MGGKYSAEWWEKILDINRESQARRDHSSLVADLVPARAKQAPAPSEPAAEKPSAPQ